MRHWMGRLARAPKAALHEIKELREGELQSYSVYAFRMHSSLSPYAVGKLDIR